VHKYVVRDQGDGEMHGQKYGDRICRLTPYQEPYISGTENERDEDREAKKEPLGRGTTPCHHRPRGSRNDDADNGQLRVVGELEMRVTPGRRDQGRRGRNE